MINIATNNGNTNACITATNNHCAYNTSGANIGKFPHARLCVNQFTHITNNDNNIPQANIFPYNLALRDNTLAASQTISSTHTNNDITISNALITILAG